MPRARSNPLFEFRGQWISTVPGSERLYRFWSDGSGRTRRQTLGTSDLEEAKLRLAETVVRGAPKDKSSPLSSILVNYFEQRTDGLPSKKVARGHGRKILAFFGHTARVEDLVDSNQREFATKLVKDGCKLSYVARIMGTLAAALEFADLREPRIRSTQAEMSKRWNLKRSPEKKPYVPSDEECARFLVSDHIPANALRWCIIAAMTGARPEAALQLSAKQFQRTISVIDLNPPDRVQNSKRRSKVKIGRPFKFLLEKWIEEGLDHSNGRFCGYHSIEGVKSAIERVSRDCGVPVSTYSLRHKVASVLRLARVPEDQVSILMGHQGTGARTTLGYGDWDPDYLREASRALTGWFWKIRRLARDLEANSQTTLKPAASPRKAAA